MSEVFDRWQVTNLRSVAISATDGFTDGDWIEAPYITDEGIRLIQTGNIGRAEFLDKAESRKYISNSSFRLLNCKLVKPGDLLTCRLADPIGRACEVPADIGDAITSVDCTIIRVDSTRFDKRFVLHWLNSEENLKRASDMAAGSTRSRISRSNLGKLPIPNPELSEQSLISKVLDTLDTAIRETEALIDKLKAVKQGLLHDLLTRGIDANGQLRPPQSEAPQLYKESPLGWIPREWVVDFGKNVCREIVVGIVIKPTQYYRESGVAVLRSANVRETGLTLDNLVFMSSKDHQSLSKSAVAKGDVLTVRTGYPGTSCVVDDQIEEANCVDIIISRPLPELDSSYWSTWINSDFGKKQVLAVQGGLAQQHFNVGDLMKLMVKMPPIAEQEVISDRLRGVLSRIDSESKEQSKLFALKAALMDDLLTGRVRVTPLLESVQQAAAQVVQQPVGQMGA